MDGSRDWTGLGRGRGLEKAEMGEMVAISG